MPRHNQSVRRSIIAAVLMSTGLAGTGLAGAASAQPATIVIAPRRPPPPRVEIIPAAPMPNDIWVNGHWAWNGVQWQWMPGRYVVRPTPRANWIPGHWRPHPGGYVWVDGRWAG